MHDDSASTDRSLEDYLLFTVAFVGFTGAAGGVVLSSPAIAFTGAAISLFALWCFLQR
jgi:hypothetical protein